MICPKCGFEQPESPECMRCGVIISRYKGPTLDAPPPPPPPPLSPSGHETVRMAFEPPAPPPPPGGTMFGEPAAAAAGGTAYGGTVYGGTVYDGPAPGTVTRAPTFGTVTSAPLGVGDLLNQTFSIYFANLIPFTLLTAICLTPLFVLQGVVLEGIKSSAAGGAASAGLLALPLWILGLVVFPNLATGAITYGVFQQLRRQDTSIGDCLGRGLSALPLVLGVALVQGFLVGLGMIACLVPGILLALRWAVSVPAAVTERAGISEAMSRSTFLTEGYRGDVFGFLFVLGILNIGLTLLVNLAVAKNPTLLLTIQSVKDLFTVGVSATGTAVLYYRLRSAKESIDVDQIAAVFA